MIPPEDHHFLSRRAHVLSLCKNRPPHSSRLRNSAFSSKLSQGAFLPPRSEERCFPKTLNVSDRASQGFLQTQTATVNRSDSARIFHFPPRFEYLAARISRPAHGATGRENCQRPRPCRSDRLNSCLGLMKIRTSNEGHMVFRTQPAAPDFLVILRQAGVNFRNQPAPWS